MRKPSLVDLAEALASPQTQASLSSPPPVTPPKNTPAIKPAPLWLPTRTPIEADCRGALPHDTYASFGDPALPVLTVVDGARVRGPAPRRPCPMCGGTTFWRFAPTCQPLCVRCHPNPKTMPRPVVVPDIGRELLRKRYEQSVQKAKERRTKGEAPAASKTSLHSS